MGVSRKRNLFSYGEDTKGLVLFDDINNNNSERKQLRQTADTKRCFSKREGTALQLSDEKAINPSQKDRENLSNMTRSTNKCLIHSPVVFSKTKTISNSRALACGKTHTPQESTMYTELNELENVDNL